MPGIIQYEQASFCKSDPHNNTMRKMYVEILIQILLYFSNMYTSKPS